MTDENVRPASQPTRETEPEPRQAEDAAADDLAVDDAAAAGETVEAEVETETEIVVPAGAAVEREDEVIEAPATEEPVAEADQDVAPEPAEAAAPATRESVVGEDETVSVPGEDVPIGDQDSDTFIWHPDHRGKTVDQVRSGLAQEIASDQRQHRLAMDGAEESEQDALASVVSLERKWGPYDFDWAEQEPEALADRITEFERERERRREMLSWSDYRDAEVDRDEALGPGERPAELSTGIKALALILVVLLIVVILLAVWAL